MKFSYKLIKKYLPDLKSKNQLREALNMYAFEAEDRDGDTLDVSIPTNRYSDAASHIGIAKEAAVILDLDEDKIPSLDLGRSASETTSDLAEIEVKNEDLCPRYTALVFEEVEVGESPDWMKDILSDCGLRPINNIVDVMNYVMLETGQPLHAFDLDELSDSKIVVRNAKDGEAITTIDDNEFKLDKSDLVIADSDKPLAIAGVKGGKEAEVSEETTRILVESASFDRANIYKTSRNIGLTTDASLRFSHELNINLPIAGLNRVEDILGELLGVTPEVRLDTNPQEAKSERAVPFNIDEFNEFIGVNISEDDAVSYLNSLGFELDGTHVHVPVLREDISTKEDLAEELVRLIGLDDLESKPPIVSIEPPSSDEVFAFRDKVRKVFTGLGFDEVYNYSFLDSSGPERVKVKNPISEDKDHLRDTLLPLITKNLEANSRFFDEIRVFEVGHIFEKDSNDVEERNMIGAGVSLQNEDPFFEIRGVLEEFLSQVGLSDFVMADEGDFQGLVVKSGDDVLGKIVRVSADKSVAELDFDLLLELVDAENSYEPLPKYPSVSRDISFIVDSSVKIGDVIQELQFSNEELIKDVDLIDEYFGEEGDNQSITLRVIFQSSERTLNSDEVDEEMSDIKSILEDQFGADIR